MLIGTLVMVASAAALVTPGTLEVTVPICIAGMLAAAAARRSYRSLMPEIGPGAMVAAAFLGYTMLSALWSARPIDTLGWALISILAFAGCGIAARYMLSEPRHNIFHISEGLWIGIFAGLAYLAVEILSDQAIKIGLYNALQLGPADVRPQQHFTWSEGRLIAIASADLTRNIAPVPLYIWATLLAIRGTTPAATERALKWFVFAFAVAVVMTALWARGTDTPVASAAMAARPPVRHAICVLLKVI